MAELRDYILGLNLCGEEWAGGREFQQEGDLSKTGYVILVNTGIEVRRIRKLLLHEGNAGDCRVAVFVRRVTVVH